MPEETIAALEHVSDARETCRSPLSATSRKPLTNPCSRGKREATSLLAQQMLDPKETPSFDAASGSHGSPGSPLRTSPGLANRAIDSRRTDRDLPLSRNG